MNSVDDMVREKRARANLILEFFSSENFLRLIAREIDIVSIYCLS